MDHLFITFCHQSSALKCLVRHIVVDASSAALLRPRRCHAILFRPHAPRPLIPPPPPPPLPPLLPHRAPHPSLKSSHCVSPIEIHMRRPISVLTLANLPLSLLFCMLGILYNSCQCVKIQKSPEQIDRMAHEYVLLHKRLFSEYLFQHSDRRLKNIL